MGECPMHVQAVAALLRNSESSTADTMAAVRALHQRQPVRIFEDPYAKRSRPWMPSPARVSRCLGRRS